jgi:hypothetical protein
MIEQSLKMKEIDRREWNGVKEYSYSDTNLTLYIVEEGSHMTVVDHPQQFHAILQRTMGGDMTRKAMKAVELTGKKGEGEQSQWMGALLLAMMAMTVVVFGVCRKRHKRQHTPIRTEEEHEM